jgi:serine/threonine protein kinase
MNRQVNANEQASQRRLTLPCVAAISIADEDLMPTLNPGAFVGNYVIVKSLEEGEGGMAQVYVARLVEEEEEEGALVALKITRMTEERADVQDLYYGALDNEVENLRKLKHPNINRLYPIQTEARTTPYIARANNISGRPWYCVMEYLAGGSLANELDQVPGGYLPLNLAVEIVYQIGLALEYIHLKGIAHLDIKPDNILFRQPLSSPQRPEAVLIDFGIARKENQTGLPAGAASYMSPERILLVRGEIPRSKHTDQRPADVYSLAIVLFRCVTGRLPFSRRDKSTTTDVILKEQPVPITRYKADAPPALEDIINRSLTKDPAKRATISEFLAALDDAVPPPRWKPAKKPTTKTETPERVVAPTRSRLKGIVIIGLVGFILMVLCASAALVMILNPPEIPAPSPSPTTTAMPSPLPRTTVPGAVATTRPPSTGLATVTPFPTFTPAPPSTPYRPTAPVLTSPTNGQVFDRDATRIVLAWTSGELPPDVFYVVTLNRYINSVFSRKDEFDMRENRFQLPSSALANVPAGVDVKFEWTVAIRRAKVNVDGTKEWDPALNVTSQVFTFSYRSPTATLVPTWTVPPTTPVPTRRSPGSPPQPPTMPTVR